jgi:hypothetical protein
MKRREGRGGKKVKRNYRAVFGVRKKRRKGKKRENGMEGHSFSMCHFVFYYYELRTLLRDESDGRERNAILTCKLLCFMVLLKSWQFTYLSLFIE